MTSTKTNRYDGAFETVRVAWGNKESPKILSFGCSAGDEMGSISEFMPGADIFGCDVDLSVAESRSDLPGKVFLSTPEAVLAHGPYDIIFANSVLCLHPSTEPAPQKFSFDDFLALCSNLNDALSPGGLLCIYNASYFFRELPFSVQYKPVRSLSFAENGFVPKHSADGEMVSIELKIWPFRFQKVLRPDRTKQGDFEDIIFRKEQGEAETLQVQTPRNKSSNHKECGVVHSLFDVVPQIMKRYGVINPEWPSDAAGSSGRQ